MSITELLEYHVLYQHGTDRVIVTPCFAGADPVRDNPTWTHVAGPFDSEEAASRAANEYEGGDE